MVARCLLSFIQKVLAPFLKGSEKEKTFLYECDQQPFIKCYALYLLAPLRQSRVTKSCIRGHGIPILLHVALVNNPSSSNVSSASKEVGGANVFSPRSLTCSTNERGNSSVTKSWDTAPLESLV